VFAANGPLAFKVVESREPFLPALRITQNPLSPSGGLPVSPDTTALPPRKRWLSFRLRTLLIVAPLIAIVASFAFRAWYADYLETRAASEIKRLGGEVVRNDAHQIVEVKLAGKAIDDDQLAELVPFLIGLPKLKSIQLMSNDISNEGLLYLERLSQVETVYLAETKVTLDGVAELNKRLPSLTIDLQEPHIKAMALAARVIYPHATVAVTSARHGEIIAGSGTGQVLAWNSSAQPRVRFQAHDDWTFSVVFHPHRNWLATGGGDGLIKLWDWSTRHEIARFEGHEDDVHAVRFTPDGRTIVSTGDDMTVRMWDLSTRRARHVLTGHSDTIPGLAISPDGTLAASASRDRTIRLWDIATGALLGVLEGHTDDVISVDFDPSGKQLASASYDNTVMIWDISTRRRMGLLPGHRDWAFAVAWSADGRHLASGSGDGMRLWQASSGQLLWHTAHQRNVSSVHWLKGGQLVSSSADGSVVVQTSDGKPLRAMWPDLRPMESELAGSGRL
jgi:WD40 repeat protein